MNTNVLRAVFKRNFVSYFASPTGYVFICVFVMLSSFAAFWPNEFFNANLANLDQLNLAFPFIMLVFIPAITMGIWAEETRQGTDELLLTIPAGDFDIVLGKYLAAVAIYTVALLFSLGCNYVVLLTLGAPDVGLFLATYFGYWLLGLAMLAVGMVASFLTRNLTVAYILGAVFNVPLVFLAWTDAIPWIGHKQGVLVKQWSYGGQFAEFGRGILSLSGLAYFLLLAAVMLYLSMIFIGRRHWGGSARRMPALHFLIRSLALVVIAAGVVFAIHHRDVRLDATSERLSSLSPHTIKLLDELKTNYDAAKVKRPVRIDAYVSPEVPESYIQTRLNLLAVLRELQARAGNMMELQINDCERFSPVAEQARKRYNIVPRRVATNAGGKFSQDNILLGVAFTCGLEKVIIPFIDRGIPVEYELVRSLCTVTQQKRKRIGVVETDAQIFGRFSMQGMSPPWPIITELQKQYEVVQVSPAQPIPLHKPAAKPGDKEEGFDVLLAVQPSAMGQPEMENFLAAIRAGQPTVIFEDPIALFTDVPGTSQPRKPADPTMAMFNRQPLAKGDIKPLWQMLGVNFSGGENRDEFPPFAGAEEDVRGGGGDQVVWQRYNPFPKLSDMPAEFVFIDNGCGSSEPFSQVDPITSKLQLLAFPGPGYIEQRNTSDLDDRKFVPLVHTGVNSGTVRVRDMFSRTMFGNELNPDRERAYVPGHRTEYVLAAHITGRLKAKPAVDPKTGKPAEKPAGPGAEVNVVLAADLDMLTEQFFRIREQGDMPGMHFDFDNVTLVLNALDSLAGDQRFLDLRKRRPRHRTLDRFAERTEPIREETIKARDQFRRDRDDATRQENDKLNDAMKKLTEEIKKDKSIDQAEVERRVEIALKNGQRRLSEKKEELNEQFNQQVQRNGEEVENKIHEMQGRFKMWAVLLPPIPPLLLAGLVFFVRRSGESEGVSRKRMK
jgi:ABC-2 type transport system permease protein